MRKGRSPQTLNGMQTRSLRRTTREKGGGTGRRRRLLSPLFRGTHCTNCMCLSSLKRELVCDLPLSRTGRHGQAGRCSAPGPAWPAPRQHCTQRPARLCWGMEPRAGHAAPLAVAGGGRAPTGCPRERDLAGHAAKSLHFTDRNTKPRDTAGPRPRSPASERHSSD